MDIKNVRVGDYVTVRVPVIGAAYSGATGLQVKPALGVITFVEPAEVVGVEAQPPRVGEMVRPRDDDFSTIVMIHGDMAWCKSAQWPNRYTSRYLRDLVRA